MGERIDKKESIGRVSDHIGMHRGIIVSVVIEATLSVRLHEATQGGVAVAGVV